MRSLIQKIFESINTFFSNGHQRSILAVKNIIALIMIKGFGILISLILVPITINYINPSRYGIWLTLSSIVAWFGFFDIGLTQGLRNRFAEAKAKGDDYVAQVYVSTTYAILIMVFTFVWILFFISNHFLNWSRILNVSADMQSEIATLASIVFTYFCISFVLKIITTILIADQKPAKASIIDLFGQVFSLIFILILVKSTEGSLIKLGIALCVSPLIVLVLANAFLFNYGYKKYKPRISKINFSYAKDLFNLGLVFFIIQIANILQFQTANIIIAKNFGTTEVTEFNIVYKYFGVLVMVFTIFLTPFWSASTEAYLQKDIQWIKSSIKKYNLLNILMVFVGFAMLIFSNTIYRLWLGEGKINIAFSISVWGFIFFNTSMYGGKYVSFLNGINALRIQLLACIFSPFLYIVSALVLIKYYGLGVSALYIASIIANFNTFILAPIQYHQVVIKGKKGIWIK
jgi:O-antigen/teichoic acid export membrane protein